MKPILRINVMKKIYFSKKQTAKEIKTRYRRRIRLVCESCGKDFYAHEKTPFCDECENHWIND